MVEVQAVMPLMLFYPLQATEDQRKLASEKEAAREEVRQLRLHSREVPLGTDNMVVNFSKEVMTPGKVSC